MLFRIHFFPGLCFLLLGQLLVLAVAQRLWLRHPRYRIVLVAATAVSTVLQMLGYLLEFQRVQRYIPAAMCSWLECAALVESMCLVGLYFALLTWEEAPKFRASRRRFVEAAGAAMCVTPVAGTFFGIVKHNQFRVSEVKVPIPNLPKDLDGLRIVQITDIHLSPFLSEREFARAIDMANETRATSRAGDGRSDHPPRRSAGCLPAPTGAPARRCRRARMPRQSRDLCPGGELCRDPGAAPGNRISAASSESASIRRRRHQFRRSGLSEDALASIWWAPNRLIVPGALNILLSHNPDVFPRGGRPRLRCDHRRPYPWRPGGFRDPAPASERRPLLHAVCARPLPRRQVVRLRIKRDGHHRRAGPLGRASRDIGSSPVRYLILSDIHANWEALQAVLRPRADPVTIASSAAAI